MITTITREWYVVFDKNDKPIAAFSSEEDAKSWMQFCCYEIEKKLITL